MAVKPTETTSSGGFQQKLQDKTIQIAKSDLGQKLAVGATLGGASKATNDLKNAAIGAAVGNIGDIKSSALGSLGAGGNIANLKNSVLGAAGSVGGSIGDIKNSILGTSPKPPSQREVPCPTCSSSNQVKEKVAGKNYFTLPFLDYKVPRLDHIVDKTTTFDGNRREGEKCPACQGKKTITDVTDDTTKYEEVSKKIEEKSDIIMDLESKLGLGGTRTTFIQGSDLLFVGLGFNNNKTYQVMPNTAIAPSMKGGKVPQQSAEQVNSIVGKQGTVAWPQQVGNYTIKCANTFNLLAGAGGITIATPGPLSFSAGLLSFSSPSLSLGSSSGPLTLQGDSVNITGKTVALTPTSGELFVKGNICNTGNITTQGHAHFESASFVKASCTGTTKSTFSAKANPDVVNTQQATWKTSALQAALLDLKTFIQAVPTNSKTSAFRLMSPKEMQNMSDRVSNISKLSLPFEIKPTGWIIPGTRIKLIGKCPCNEGGSAFGEFDAYVTRNIDLHNFPHIHGIPEMMHLHEITLPDIDCTNDTPEALRGKMLTGAHESGVPADPTKDTKSRLLETAKIAKEFVAQVAVDSIKLTSKIIRFLS